MDATNQSETVGEVTTVSTVSTVSTVFKPGKPPAKTRPARAQGATRQPSLRAKKSWWAENWLWLFANVGAAVPLLWLAWDTWQGNLTINPIADFTKRTGGTAIILLLLTLAVTPINTITGWRQVVGLRKSLGLWTFCYALLHFLVFVGLDYGFSLEFILADGLPSKPYAVVGFAALLILLPLAITSTKGWQKRLGRNWKRLHRWVYAAGILAVVHYLWVAKVIFGQPVVYAMILALLLAARIPSVRSWLSKLRTHVKGAPARSSGQMVPMPAATPAVTDAGMKDSPTARARRKRDAQVATEVAEM